MEKCNLYLYLLRWIMCLFLFSFFARFWLKVQLEMILLEILPLMTFPSWTVKHMKVKGHSTTDIWTFYSNFIVLIALNSLIFNFHCWFVFSTIPCCRRTPQTEYHNPFSDHPGPHSSAPQLPWWRVCVWGTWGVCCQQQSVRLQTRLFRWFRWNKLR